MCHHDVPGTSAGTSTAQCWHNLRAERQGFPLTLGSPLGSIEAPREWLSRDASLKKKDAQVGRQKVLRQLDFEPHNEIKKSD